MFYRPNHFRFVVTLFLSFVAIGCSTTTETNKDPNAALNIMSNGLSAFSIRVGRISCDRYKHWNDCQAYASYSKSSQSLYFQIGLFASVDSSMIVYFNVPLTKLDTITVSSGPGGTYGDLCGYATSIEGGTIQLTKVDTIHNLVSAIFQIPLNTGDTLSGYATNLCILDGAFGQGTLSWSADSIPVFASDDGIEHDKYGFVHAWLAPDTTLTVEGGAIHGVFPHELMISLKAVKVGTFPLGTALSVDSATYKWPDAIGGLVPYPARRGSVTITKLDPVKRLISGTFYFRGFNAEGDSVTVRNGAFNDIVWAQW
jgi:hypothetical protein